MARVHPIEDYRNFGIMAHIEELTVTNSLLHREEP